MLRAVDIVYPKSPGARIFNTQVSVEGPDVYDKGVPGFALINYFAGSAINSLNDLPGASSAQRDREHTDARQGHLDLVKKHDSLSQLSECDGDGEKNAPEEKNVTLGSGGTSINDGSSSGTSDHDKVEHDLAWR